MFTVHNRHLPVNFGSSTSFCSKEPHYASLFLFWCSHFNVWTRNALWMALGLVYLTFSPQVSTHTPSCVNKAYGIVSTYNGQFSPTMLLKFKKPICRIRLRLVIYWTHLIVTTGMTRQKAISLEVRVRIKILIMIELVICNRLNSRKNRRSLRREKKKSENECISKCQ